MTSKNRNKDFESSSDKNKCNHSRFSRRDFLKISGAYSAAALGGINLFDNLPSRSSIPPNIVILMADDMGWDDVGYHGSEIQTPNLDFLAENGVELDRFYSCPTCSPSRTAMLTGRNPARMGITSPIHTGSPGPDVDEHFLPQSFKQAGYQTWLVGKWHLGGSTGSQFLPTNRGFDHFYGHLGGGVTYYSHLSPSTRAADWQRNGEAIDEEGYTTYLLEEEAENLIRTRDKSKPFFLDLSFNAPHIPLEAPQELIDKYSSIRVESRRIYAAMVDAMDSSIGKLMDVLDEEGIRDNTLVLFYSDNGADEDSDSGSSYPLNGDKGTVYEGGIRLPAIMYWPGVIAPGRICDQVMSSMDIFSTFAAATGIVPGNQKRFDGVNRWDHIVGDIENVQPENLVIISGSNAAILHGEWKMVKISDRSTRLYKINEDPTESNDLSSSYPEIIQDLEARIISATDVSTSVEEVSAVPDGFKLEQNYPNPFNPSTSIAYTLPVSSRIRIEIFNIKGQKIKKLIETVQAAGTYSISWNGTNDLGQNIATGSYIYRMTAGNYADSKTLTFIK